MTTTLSLPAVPVGGFCPTFSNFTLCGYLHSVITIPSILIFPVQTMCPGYTHTRTHTQISLVTYALTCTNKYTPVQKPCVLQHALTGARTHRHTHTHAVCVCEREIEEERQMWTVTTPNSLTHAITLGHHVLEIQLQSNLQPLKLGLFKKLVIAK